MNSKNFILIVAMVTAIVWSQSGAAQSLEEQFRQAENAKAAQANAEGEKLLQYVANNMRRYKYVMGGRPVIFKVERVYASSDERCLESLDNVRIYIVENVAFMMQYIQAGYDVYLRSFIALGRVEGGKLVFDEKRSQVLNAYGNHDLHLDSARRGARDSKCKYELNFAAGEGFYAVNNKIVKMQLSRAGLDEYENRRIANDFYKSKGQLLNKYPALSDRIHQIFDGQ